MTEAVADNAACEDVEYDSEVQREGGRSPEQLGRFAIRRIRTPGVFGDATRHFLLRSKRGVVQHNRQAEGNRARYCQAP